MQNNAVIDKYKNFEVFRFSEKFCLRMYAVLRNLASLSLKGLKSDEKITR